MTKNVMTLSYEEDHVPLPAVKQYFSLSFPFAAGTSGAPPLLDEIQLDKDHTLLYAGFIPRLLQKIEETKKRKGVVCIAALIVTHPEVLKALQGVDTVIIMQKFASRNSHLVELYGELGCTYRRDAFPGDVISHLVRRDNQEDYGLLDGVRVIGNLHQTIRMVQNEDRPYANPKLVVGLDYSKSTGKLKCSYCFNGSSNISVNSEHSFMHMMLTTAPKEVEAYYAGFAHYWSHSEELHNLSPGVEVRYLWEKQPVVYPTLPNCSGCGKPTRRKTMWVPDINNPKLAVQKMVCAECKQRMDYVNPFAKRVW